MPPKAKCVIHCIDYFSFLCHSNGEVKAVLKFRIYIDRINRLGATCSLIAIIHAIASTAPAAPNK